ncbi:MAG: hydantoinase B/oxoprolinase family protein, partial [Pseudomonadota bacterium]
MPEQWRGDYLAMLGAARIGERDIRRMGAELGWEALAAHAADWFDLCEEQMARTIRELKPGTERATCTHDPLPGTPPDGIPANATVTIDPGAATVTVDLIDNIDALPVGVNLSHACARTAAMVGVLNSMPRSLPANSGTLRRIEVKLREGSCVGIPRHPTSTSVATTNLGDRVTNAVQRAIAMIDPRCGMAEGGAAIPPASGVVSGTDPRTGEPFVNQVILAAGGGAGVPTEDGWLSLFTMGNAGMPFYDSVEVDEMLHPILVTTRRLAPDSEGAGMYRGAPGVLTEYRPVDCEIELGYCSDGTVNPALGVQGGGAAVPARQWLADDAGTVTPLGTSAQVRVRADQTVVSYSNGGGGYGDPARRDPARVVRDVREGWITVERAREIYRVALLPDGSVDQEATDALRGARAEAA